MGQAPWVECPQPSLEVLEWQASRAQVAGVEQELQAAKNELLSKRDEELDSVAHEFELAGSAHTSAVEIF